MEKHAVVPRWKSRICPSTSAATNVLLMPLMPYTSVPTAALLESMTFVPDKDGSVVYSIIVPKLVPNRLEDTLRGEVIMR